MLKQKQTEECDLRDSAEEESGQEKMVTFKPRPERAATL